MTAGFSYGKAGCFNSWVTSWDSLCSEVAALATQVGQENLINMTHS